MCSGVNKVKYSLCCGFYIKLDERIRSFRLGMLAFSFYLYSFYRKIGIMHSAE